MKIDTEVKLPKPKPLPKKQPLVKSLPILTVTSSDPHNGTLQLEGQSLMISVDHNVSDSQINQSSIMHFEELKQLIVN